MESEGREVSIYIKGNLASERLSEGRRQPPPPRQLAGVCY